MPQRLRSLVGSVMALALPLLAGSSPISAAEFTPSSPEVTAMVDKALAYLDKESVYQGEARLGGKCLVAMAFYKAGHPASHPRVVGAVKACQTICQDVDREHKPNDIYNYAIATFFLADLDPKLHRKEIDRLLQLLTKAQKPHGGWGYYGKPPGDTSMTQYAVLSLWTMQQAGIPIKSEMVNKAARWLVRTQTPEGPWGYQAKDPGNYDRIRQDRTNDHAMFAAGIGSTYICADMLGMSGDIQRAAARGIQILPEAFVPVSDEGRKPRLQASADLVGLIGRATTDGNNWFSENYKINIEGRFPYYYLYAIERYMSFRELAESGTEGHPPWYDDGVRFLQESQNESGEWNDNCGYVPATALGTLFLLRSTQKSIDRANYGQGLLSGGRGLPKDIANAQVRRGKVVGQAVGGKAGDVLSILEDPNNPKFEALVDNPGAIALSRDSANQASEVERFRRILRSSNQPQARRLAVTALGQQRDLENVPTLIYALTDGDQRVSVSARDALRFVSRKLGGFGMSSFPTKQDKLAATKRWKDWYRSIRPDAQFIE